MSDSGKRRKEVESVYTPLSDALRELESRRKDEQLEKKIKEFFGDKFLDFLDGEPKAVLSRPTVTPNFEFKYFNDLLREVDLEPLFLEYGGKFVAKNPEKLSRAKMSFFHGFGKKMGTKKTNRRVVNFNKWEGKNMREVKTIHGEPLVDFHRRLFDKHLPNLKGKTIDFFEWFNTTRSLTEFYYLYFLALFIRHGILFENFIIQDEEEMKFFSEKVLPSFKKVEQIFGAKPLITPLLPLRDERDFDWLSYPPAVLEDIPDMPESE